MSQRQNKKLAFRRTPSLRSMIILIIIFVLCVSFQLILYWWEDGIKVADRQGDHPFSEQFHVNGTPISNNTKLSFIEKWLYWRAMRKFPTLSYCLGSEGQTGLDLSYFNWKSLRNEAQAEVCLNHISSALGTPVLVAEWLQEQGFKSSSHKPSSTYGTIVEAYWRKGENESLSPFSALSMWGIGELSPLVRSGVRISITYNETDGFVKYTQINYSTL